MSGLVRLLLVLPDTDASADNERVLKLHRDLAAAGIEVRTVAIGPGPRGGLDAAVPVLAPSRRSPAAITQLRREQRWADVVACSGGRAARVQALGGSRRRVPVVVLPRQDWSPGPGDELRSRSGLRGATVVESWMPAESWVEFFSACAAGSGAGGGPAGGDG